MSSVINNFMKSPNRETLQDVLTGLTPVNAQTGQTRKLNQPYKPGNYIGFGGARGGQVQLMSPFVVDPGNPSKFSMLVAAKTGQTYTVTGNLGKDGQPSKAEIQSAVKSFVDNRYITAPLWDPYKNTSGTTPQPPANKLNLGDIKKGLMNAPFLPGGLSAQQVLGGAKVVGASIASVSNPSQEREKDKIKQRAEATALLRKETGDEEMTLGKLTYSNGADTTANGLRQKIQEKLGIKDWKNLLDPNERKNLDATIAKSGGRRQESANTSSQEGKKKRADHSQAKSEITSQPAPVGSNRPQGSIPGPTSLIKSAAASPASWAIQAQKTLQAIPVTLNLFDQKLGLSFGEGNLFDKGVRGLANGIGNVVGSLAGMRESTELEKRVDGNRASTAFGNLKLQGVDVKNDGTFRLPNTKEGGQFLAALVRESGIAGDLSATPGLWNVSNIRGALPALAKQYGLGKEFIEGYNEAHRQYLIGGAASTGASMFMAGNALRSAKANPIRPVRDFSPVNGGISPKSSNSPGARTTNEKFGLQEYPKDPIAQLKKVLETPGVRPEMVQEANRIALARAPSYPENTKNTSNADRRALSAERRQYLDRYKDLGVKANMVAATSKQTAETILPAQSTAEKNVGTPGIRSRVETQSQKPPTPDLNTMKVSGSGQPKPTLQIANPKPTQAEEKLTPPPTSKVEPVNTASLKFPPKSLSGVNPRPNPQPTKIEGQTTEKTVAQIIQENAARGRLPEKQKQDLQMALDTQNLGHFSPEVARDALLSLIENAETKAIASKFLLKKEITGADKIILQEALVIAATRLQVAGRAGALTNAYDERAGAKLSDVYSKTLAFLDEGSAKRYTKIVEEISSRSYASMSHHEFGDYIIKTAKTLSPKTNSEVDITHAIEARANLGRIAWEYKNPDAAGLIGEKIDPQFIEAQSFIVKDLLTKVAPSNKREVLELAGVRKEVAEGILLKELTDKKPILVNPFITPPLYADIPIQVSVVNTKGREPVEIRVGDKKIQFNGKRNIGESQRAAAESYVVDKVKEIYSEIKTKLKNESPDISKEELETRASQELNESLDNGTLRQQIIKSSENRVNRALQGEPSEFDAGRDWIAGHKVLVATVTSGFLGIVVSNVANKMLDDSDGVAETVRKANRGQLPLNILFASQPDYLTDDRGVKVFLADKPGYISEKSVPGKSSPVMIPSDQFFLDSAKVREANLKNPDEKVDTPVQKLLNDLVRFQNEKLNQMPGSFNATHVEWALDREKPFEDSPQHQDWLKKLYNADPESGPVSRRSRGYERSGEKFSYTINDQFFANQKLVNEYIGHLEKYRDLQMVALKFIGVGIEVDNKIASAGFGGDSEIGRAWATASVDVANVINTLSRDAVYAAREITKGSQEDADRNYQNSLAALNRSVTPVQDVMRSSLTAKEQSQLSTEVKTAGSSVQSSPLDSRFQQARADVVKSVKQEEARIQALEDILLNRRANDSFPEVVETQLDASRKELDRYRAQLSALDLQQAAQVNAQAVESIRREQSRYLGIISIVDPSVGPDANGFIAPNSASVGRYEQKFDADVSSAESNLSSGEQKINTATIAVNTARRNRDSTNTLVEGGALGWKNRDDSNAAVRTAESVLNEVLESRGALQSQLELAKVRRREADANVSAYYAAIGKYNDATRKLSGMENK